MSVPKFSFEHFVIKQSAMRFSLLKVFCSESRNSLINAVNVSTKITVRVLISLKVNLPNNKSTKIKLNCNQ